MITRSFRLIALLMALVAMAACFQGCALRGAGPSIAAPNALSPLDNRAFIVLGTTASALEEIKKTCAPATCPQAKKDALNHIIDAYNTARDAWLAYRTALQAGSRPQDAALSTVLAAVVSAMENFKGVQ